MRQGPGPPAAVEAPFDPADIKWRVTNTVTTGSRNGPVLRGQVLAYADPRVYTDRLNELFGPAGWTRDYVVQVAQNFERKERGATERTITARASTPSRTPRLSGAIIERANARGCDSATLNAVVDHIVALTAGEPAAEPAPAGEPELAPTH